MPWNQFAFQDDFRWWKFLDLHSGWLGVADQKHADYCSAIHEIFAEANRDLEEWRASNVARSH